MGELRGDNDGGCRRRRVRYLNEMRIGGCLSRVLRMILFQSAFGAHHCRNIVLHLALEAGMVFVVKILDLWGDWKRIGLCRL